ncbi:MAG: hypothetical protein RMN24_10030 [Anaerolineae bacterium]|nr:hypothetical protein [Anaerolineae bacterium]
MSSSPLLSSATVARQEHALPAALSTTTGLLARVTVEHLAYGLLVVVGLVTRGIGLGSRPLAPAEAEGALAAWQMAQGLGQAADAGAPLLVSLQTLLFFLAGGSDFLARLAPMLAAAALPLAVGTWRAWVGRRTALLAALLLTLSPLVNAFGRRADAAAFALLGLALALGGWGRLHGGDRAGWRRLFLGSGLILVSGSAGPAALLGLFLAVLLTHRAMPADRPRPTWADAVSGLVLAFVGGTVFLTHIPALGLMALNWSEWLSLFTVAPAAWLWGAVRLLSDEPLLVLMGTAATLWLWRRPGSAAARGLGQAGLALLLVAVLQGPLAAGTRAVAAVLLAAPAAAALRRFWRRGRHLAASGTLPAEWPVFVGVLSILLVVAALALFGYAYTQLRVQLLLFGLTVLVAALFVALFTYLAGRWSALLLGGAVCLVFLTAYNLAAAWGLAFDATPPRYAALYAVESRPAVRDLAVTVGVLGQRRQGERWSLPVTLVSGSASDATLQWYLRRAPSVRVVPAVGGAEAGPLVVAPAAAEAPLSEAYTGQRFTVFSDWQPQAGTPQQQLAWMLYRIAPWDLPTVDVVLWADARLVTLEEGF